MSSKCATRHQETDGSSAQIQGFLLPSKFLCSSVEFSRASVVHRLARFSPCGATGTTIRIWRMAVKRPSLRACLSVSTRDLPPNSCLHGRCVVSDLRAGVLSPPSRSSWTVRPPSDTAVRLENASRLRQIEAPVAGLEPAISPADLGCSNQLNHTGDALFTRAFRASSRCCVLSMRYCPSLDPKRIQRKTRGSNPQPAHHRRPISNRLANHSPIFQVGSIAASRHRGWS